MSKQDKQKSIFDILVEKVTGIRANYVWEIRVDGASRGNPGPSGAGIYILKDGKDFIKTGFFLGHKTNNQAEYLALLIALILLKKEIKESEAITVFSDSQILIRQLQGVYQVKNQELSKLYNAIVTELKPLTCQFEHVDREYNTVADQMANEGIDKHNSLPLKFLDKLRTYEIFL